MSAPVPYFYYNFDANTINGLNLANLGTTTAGTGMYDASLSNTNLCFQSDYRIVNQQATFNGSTNEFVKLPAFTSDTNGLTFCFWFRTYGCTNWPRIFDFGNGAPSENIILGMNTTGSAGLIPTGTGQGVNFNLSLYITTTQSTIGPVNTINIADNVWRHFAWTISSGAGNTAGTYSFYLNGKFLYSQAGQIPNTVSRTINYLGKSNWAADPVFNGAIDEFQMYKSTLTAAQIAAIYNGTVASYSISPSIYANYNDGKNDQMLATTAVSTTGLTHHYTFDSATVGGGAFGATNLQNVATGLYDASLSNMSLISTNYVNGAFSISNLVGTTYYYNYSKPIIGRYVTGNGALTMDASGYSNYVTINSTMAATPTNTAGNGLTFCFWLRSAGIGDYARVFEFGNGWISDNIVCNVAGNDLAFYVAQGTGTNNVTVNAIPNISDNVWRHITWTITSTGSGQTANWSVYVNGLLVTTSSNLTYGYPASLTRNQNFIGKSATTTAAFNGAVDDFRKYDRVLTAAEIAQIGNLNPLYFYYSFEPGTTSKTGLVYRIYSGYHGDLVTYDDTAALSSAFTQNTGFTTNFTNLTTATNSVVIANNGQTGHSIVWQGYFLADFTGTWTFRLESDDGSYMWIGTNALSGYTTSNVTVNNGGNHGVTAVTGTVSLISGTYYPIRILYGDGGGGYDCQFSWSRNGSSYIYNGAGYFFNTAVANMATGKASYDANMSSMNMITTTDYKVGSASVAMNSSVSYLTQSPTAQAYPPAAMTSNSTTISNMGYGNGTYTASASSASSYPAWGAFDKVAFGSSAANSWTPANLLYNVGSSPYLGYSATGTATTTISGTAVKGEWLQLQMPSAIIIAGYSINAYSNRAPTRFYIAGSNNGTTWTQIDYEDTGSAPWPTNTTVTNYFDLPANTTSYSYYRFVQVTANTDGWGGMGELVFYTNQQYIQLPSFWTGNNGLTFACWFKSNNSQTYARLFDFGCGGASGFRGINNADGNKNILVELVNGTLTCITMNENNNNRNEFATAFQVNDNVWRHMAWTMATDGTWKLYINGQMTNMKVNKYPDNVLRYFNYIGKSNWSADPYFSGGIDDFRMYKSVLSDSEIQALYKGSTLAIHYTFDAETVNGSVIEDLVGTPATLKTGVIAVSPNNLLATAASWTTPEGVTWTASANTSSSTAYTAFNSTYGSSGWVTPSSLYSASTGLYAATASNSVSGITLTLETVPWAFTPTTGFPQSGNSVFVAMSNSGQYAIAGGMGAGNFWYSSDYGKTWTKTATTSLTGEQSSCAMSSTGQYCIMPTGYNGGIWYSSNYGQTWTKSSASTVNYWGAAISPNGTYAIAGTNSNGVYYSTNSGAAWTQSTGISASAAMNSVSLASTGNAVAGGTGIYYSSNNGQSWTVSSISTGGWYVAIATNGTYAIAASNSSSGIYYSSNNGQTWTVSNISTSGWTFVSMSQTGDYCLATSSSSLGIYYSVNRGQTWSRTNTITGTYYSVAMSGDGTRAIAGSATSAGIIYANVSNTSIPGEWLQIQSSTPMQLTSHNLTNYHDVATNYYSPALPKNYYIVGSTDGSTWYPIQNVNYLANSTKYTSSEGSRITRTIQTTTNTTKATYGASFGYSEVTGYATSLNYYSYFRLIACTLIGTQFGGYPSNAGGTRCIIGNWNITGLTQSTSLTSSILLGNLDSGIMTPCSFPPTGELAYTSGPSRTGYSYPMNYWISNNITWIATSSSSYEESTYSITAGNSIEYRWHCFYAFTGMNPSSGDYSWTSVPMYNTSTGAYEATIPASTIVQSPLSLTVNGEWLQITSSTPIQMLSHSLLGRHTRQQEMPNSYYIVGSNDNTTWYPVQKVVRTGGTKGAVPALDVATIKPTARLKTATTSYVDVTAGFTSTVTGYSTSSGMYTNFRLITTNTAANGASLVSLSQWYITATTNKVSTTNYATGTGSLVLDGNYGQCVSIPKYQFKNTGISIATWFNITTIPANGPSSISSTLFEFGTGFQNNGIICYFQGTSLKFGVWNGLQTAINGTSATTAPVYQFDNIVISSVSTATWYHVAITMSTSGTWQFYVNGQLTATYTNYPYPYDVVRDVNFIGRSSNSANPAFTGYIDDFRVYRSAISAAKIGSLYALQNTQELISTSSDSVAGYSQQMNDLSQLYKRNYSYMGGVISTVAGTGTGGYSGDGGLATEAQLSSGSCQDIALDSSNNIFIAEFYNHRIRRVDAQTGIITTVCGNGNAAAAASTASVIGDGGYATNATVNNPNDIFIDPNNNIYFTEYTGARIRKIAAVNGQYSSTSIITTICGGSAATNSASSTGNLATTTQITLPYGLFIDASGNIYFVQDANAATNAYIRKITTSTGILTNILGTGVGNASSAAGLAGLSTTYKRCCGVVVDTNLNVYYIDTDGCMVRKMPYSNGSYGTIVTLAGTSGTSTYTGDGGLAVSATLNSICGIAIDGSNNLYICSGNTIRMINQQTGIISTIMGGATAAYTGDGGLAINALANTSFRSKLDSYGNLYFSDRGNNVIRKITRQGLLSSSATGFQVSGQDINTLYSPQIGAMSTAQNNVTGFLTNGKALPNFEPTIHKAIPVPGYKFTSNTLSANNKNWIITSSSATATQNDAYNAFNGSINDYWLDGNGDYSPHTGSYQNNGLAYTIYDGYPSVSTSISISSTLTIQVTPATGFALDLTSFITTSNNTLTTSSSVTSQQNFTMVMNGYFLADYTGTWTFKTNVLDDVTYLWIGNNFTPGQYIVSSALYGSGASNTSLQGTISLVSGTYYPIQIVAANGGGPGNFNLSWSRNGSTYTSLGTGYLFNAIPSTISNYITPCINNCGIIDTNVNYLTTTYAGFFPSTGNNAFVVSIGASNTKMVICANTGLYYSTSSDNGVTWTTPTSFISFTTASDHSVSITYAGDRIVYCPFTALGAYYVTWTGSTPSTSQNRIGSDTKNYTYFSHSSSGNVLAACLFGTGGGVYFSTYSNGSYSAFTSVLSSTVAYGVSLSQDATRLAVSLNSTGTGGVSIYFWNGTTYTNSVAITIGSGNALTNQYGRVAVFSPDMNILYYATANGTANQLYVGYWTGATYSNFNMIPTSTLPQGQSSRCFLSNDGYSLYVTFYTNYSMYKLNVAPFSAGEWLQVQLPYPLQLTEYSLLTPVLYPFDTTPYREPTIWGVMGSNDGQTWYLVDGQTQSPTAGGVVRAFLSSDSSSYTYFRLVINKLYANALSTTANLCQWNLNGVYTYTDSNVPIASNYGNVEQLVPTPGFVTNSSSTVSVVGTTNSAVGFNYNNQSYIVSSSSVNSGGSVASGTLDFNNWPAFRGAQSVNSPVDGISYHTASTGLNPNTLTTFFGGNESAVTAPFGTLTLGVLGAEFTTSGLAVSADNSVLVYCNWTNKVGYATNTGGTWTNKGAISDATVRNYIAIALTNDGNRLLTLVYGGLAYIAIWTGSSFGTLIPTSDATTRGYRGMGMNADGSRVIAVTDSNTVWMATWSTTTNNYSAFTTIITGTTANYTGAAMSQDGTRIAYVDGATGNLYVGYWNGATYSSAIVTNNTSSLFSAFTNNSSSRNLGFSTDKNILYLSTYSPQTKGSYSLFAAYYNNVTQKYGDFYPNTALTSTRDGWGMCVSPDGKTIWLAYYAASGSFSNVSTVQYTAPGDWLQIQFAKPAKLTSYGFLCRPTLSVRMPELFVMLGSNDGATWYLVDANNEQTTDNITRSDLTTGATITSYVPPLGNSTLITYGTTTSYACNFYSYYRIVTVGIYNKYSLAVNIGEVVMRGVYL